MIEFPCSACGVNLRAKTEDIGRHTRCPQCGQTVRIVGKSGSHPNSQLSRQEAARVLGIQGDASPSAVRDAYLKLCDVYHPEHGTAPEATKFVAVTAAYKTLNGQYGSGGSQTSLPVRRWSDFITPYKRATEETLTLAQSQRDAFTDRIVTSVQNQVQSYSSASELRKRAKRDIDAIVQREVWNFVQRVSRRSKEVEAEFGAWVHEIRHTAYEADMPKGVLEFLARPVGLLLFLIMTTVVLGSVGLTVYKLWPTWQLDEVRTILLAAVGAFALICGTVWICYKIYMASCRKRISHKLQMLTAEIGYEGFDVSAVPIPEGLSREERAGIYGAGGGVVALWLGVEPITGGIAAAAIASWGFLTGKSLSKTRRDVIASATESIEMRLDDFFDALSYKVIEVNQHRLEQMRMVYLRTLGPEADAQHRTIEFDVPVRSAGASRQEHGDTGRDEEEKILAALKEVLFAHKESGIYIKPDIPSKKLSSALVAYGQSLRPGDVLLLYDSTLMGGAGEGLILARDQLAWKIEDSRGQLSFSEITRVVAAAKKKSFFGSPRLFVNGRAIDMLDDGLASALAKAIKSIVAQRKRDTVLG